MIILSAKIDAPNNNSINIDRKNVISMETTVQDRADLQTPSWGVISNTGHIEFKDVDGKIRDYAEQLILQGGLSCEISIRNTLYYTEETVSRKVTEQWTYDGNSRVVGVSLKDDLEEWQYINVEGFEYDPRNPSKVLPNKSMEDLYKWLYDKTPPKYDMFYYDELDASTRLILRQTVIPYPFLYTANLWAQWNKLCTVCGLCIYKNDVGRTACKYIYGE